MIMLDQGGLGPTSPGRPDQPTKGAVAPRSHACSSANPPLRRRIKLGAFAALDQRYAVPGMTLEETASHTRHHLTLAGRSDTLFSADAVALIHQTSRGLPRAVNNLAIQALIAAYSEDKGMVDESSTRTAITETMAE
jgi:type II secretory pathway predicted ATPase ExeA